MTQTFSKGPTQCVQGVCPAFLERGKGSHVWDVDGNEYIDFIAALGPIILGYDWPSVTESVTNQVRLGSTFSLPHVMEIELAERLVDLIPCAEMVRYGKNGSDATTGAIRVASAYTGRQKIACCGYHGWHDWYIGTTARNLGVPNTTQGLTFTFEYNNIASLEAIFDANHGEIAAVIMEPVGVVEPQNDFLSKVVEITHNNGSILIFDEVVTGFRLAAGGAQQYYGVIPDLACYGKAIANGFPLSVVAGRRDIMALFQEVFYSVTFGGDAIALAAALATVREITEKNVPAHLWEQGQKLKDGYNVITREIGVSQYTRCVGLAPRTMMSFEDVDGADGLTLRSLLQQELVKRGVLFFTGLNVCFSHSDADVLHTLRAFRAALDYMAVAIASGRLSDFLEGPPVQSVLGKS